MTAGPELVAAARLLLVAERGGTRIDGLPESLCPATLAAGYAIQDAFAALWGAPAAGWKIAATSAGGRAMLGVEGPLAGRLFADRMHASGDVVPLPATGLGVMEVELAFSVGRPLVPRAAAWDPAEAADAMASLHVAVELPQTRFRDVAAVGAPQVAADNACGGPLVLGPPVPEALWLSRGRDLSAVSGWIGSAGETPAEGRGANVLGDPLAALAWLVQAVTGRGISIAAGEVISTGSVTTPPEVSSGAQVLAELGGLGQLRFSVA
jgi:2-keto-4-pentenoate hydratase